jgi:hypothetical protein
MYEAPDDERDAAGQLAPLEQNGDRAVNWMTGGRRRLTREDDDGSRLRLRDGQVAGAHDHGDRGDLHGEGRHHEGRVLEEGLYSTGRGHKWSERTAAGN